MLMILAWLVLGPVLVIFVCVAWLATLRLIAKVLLGIS
jgi:hypothetical protein